MQVEEQPVCIWTLNGRVEFQGACRGCKVNWQQQNGFKVLSGATGQRCRAGRDPKVDRSKERGQPVAPFAEGKHPIYVQVNEWLNGRPPRSPFHLGADYADRTSPEFNLEQRSRELRHACRTRFLTHCGCLFRREPRYESAREFGRENLLARPEPTDRARFRLCGPSWWQPRAEPPMASSVASAPRNHDTDQFRGSYNPCRILLLFGADALPSRPWPCFTAYRPQVGGHGHVLRDKSASGQFKASTSVHQLTDFVRYTALRPCEQALGSINDHALA